MIDDVRLTPFARHVISKAQAAGLSDFEFVASTAESNSFGDSEAILRIGPLHLRFIRDRGQEYMDVAFSETPDHFYMFEDLETAMGWRGVSEVFGRHVPKELDRALGCLAEHFSELCAASSGPPAKLTIARVERAERTREAAFLRSLAEK